MIALSKILTDELGKGFSRPNLINMKKFYESYPSGQTLPDHLSWSHYCELLSVKPEDIIRNPYVLEFLGLPDAKPTKESGLEKKLLNRIEDFLLELGRGFMFVGTQQRVTIGNIHHKVDMVFYNKILKAYVLID